MPFDIAFDMHLYYQGYQNPSQFLNEQNRKRQQEKERMINITNKDYLRTFDGFVDGFDADEHARENAFLDLDSINTIIKKKGQQHQSLNARDIQCSYCKTTIFEI